MQNIFQSLALVMVEEDDIWAQRVKTEAKHYDKHPGKMIGELHIVPEQHQRREERYFEIYGGLI